MIVFALLATPTDRPGDALLGIYSTREAADAHVDAMTSADPYPDPAPFVVEVAVDSAPMIRNLETAGF